MKAPHGIPPPGASTEDGFGQIGNCSSYSKSSVSPRSVRPSRARGSQRGARVFAGEIYDRRRV
jgi:hypothetical protein